MNTAFNKHIYRLLLLAALVALAVGTIFYHLVEHLGWLDAYYFSVITLATVGYGDITPHTSAGKLFTTFYVLFGVGIITTFISYSMRRRAVKAEQRHSSKKRTEN
jgi:voltage-gated potassium channel